MYGHHRVSWCWFLWRRAAIYSFSTCLCYWPTVVLADTELSRVIAQRKIIEVQNTEIVSVGAATTTAAITTAVGTIIGGATITLTLPVATVGFVTYGVTKAVSYIFNNL